MSSETSTEAPSADALQPWQLFTLAGLIGATIVVFLSRGQSPAGVIVLSLSVFAAAVVGVAALRTLLPLTRSSPPDGAQMLGGRTRAALEREKALVLRSIKELEFDRAMGKVSEKDFAEMGGRLRSRATRLMRQLDAGSVYRQEIEREVERRVGKSSGSTAPSAGASGTVKKSAPDARLQASERTFPEILPEPEARTLQSADSSPHLSGPAPTLEQPAAHLATHACASCNTENDSDARFCKRCGDRLEAPPVRPEASE